MNFLAQKIDGEIVHDFVYTLVQSKKYYDWSKEVMNIHFINSTSELVMDYYTYIPVGSVEFVKGFVEEFWPDFPHPGLVPLNVPDCLFPWAGRMIKNVMLPSDMSDFDRTKRVYRKLLSTIKDPTNGMYRLSDMKDVAFIGCQVSEEIEILSEWRVLVFRDKAVYIANYSGDPLKFPNRDIIEDMIKVYEKNEAPVAYTLDVGVNDTEGTFVIECHRFFSCGLYGFSDYRLYPKMLSQAWYEIKCLK